MIEKHKKWTKFYNFKVDDRKSKLIYNKLCLPKSLKVMINNENKIRMIIEITALIFFQLLDDDGVEDMMVL